MPGQSSRYEKPQITFRPGSPVVNGVRLSLLLEVEPLHVLAPQTAPFHRTMKLVVACPINGQNPSCSVNCNQDA